MAVIAFQALSKLVTDYLIDQNGSVTLPDTWYVLLSTTPVADMARDSVVDTIVAGSNINEIGTTDAQGYERQAITPNADFGGSTFDPSPVGGGQAIAAIGVTFGPFTDAPDPNGAVSWVVVDVDNTPYWAQDLGTTVVFAFGDSLTEAPALKVG